MEILTAETDDGVRLSLRRFLPPPLRESRRAILVTHAMMTDARYLHAPSAGEGGFAGALAVHGFDVFVLDWRGHGASKPPDPRRHRWCFDDYVVFDLPAALRAVAQVTRCVPNEIGIVGHSLGGLVSLAALGTGVVRARRLILAATSVWLPGPHGPPMRRAVMRLYGGVAAALGYAPIRRLRLGREDESVGYVSQLAGWAGTGRWTSRDGVDYLAALPAVEVPTWAVLGVGDRLCTPADAAAICSRLRNTGPVRVVGRSTGDAFDPDHFTLFTRREMAPVWAEIATHLT